MRLLASNTILKAGRTYGFALQLILMLRKKILREKTLGIISLLLALLTNRRAKTDVIIDSTVIEKMKVAAMVIILVTGKNELTDQVKLLKNRFLNLKSIVKVIVRERAPEESLKTTRIHLILKITPIKAAQRRDHPRTNSTLPWTTEILDLK